MMGFGWGKIMDESDTIEQAMARYHEGLAADDRPAAEPPSAAVRKRPDSIAGLAFLAAVILFIGTFVYGVIGVKSQATTMITHWGMPTSGSSFPIAALIYFVLCVPFLFSSIGSLVSRLFLGLSFGVLGSLQLGVALDMHADSVAEAAIFAHGGSRAPETFPIVRTSVDHHARGPDTYSATIDAHGHGRGPEMQISTEDFDRINAGSRDHGAPGHRYCVTFQVETHGSDQRILWSKYDPTPSAWITDCPANEAAS
jgi:hypothetical protein